MLKIQKNLIFIFTQTLFIIAFASLIAFGQIAVPELFSGQTIERELTGAETHSYKLDLKKDEFFQVRVEQKGVDVALKLIDTKANVLATMDSPNSKEGPETLSFVAEKAGSFILEISGFDANAEKGVYTIKRQASRKAVAADKQRMAAEKSFVEAMAARGVEEQYETVVKKFEESLKSWQELKDEYLVQLTAQQISQLKAANAKAIFDEAFKLFNQKTAESYTAALLKYQQASRLFSEIDDKSRTGKSLVGAGFISDLLGDKTAALEFYKKALPLFQIIKDKKWESKTLNNIGQISSDIGDKQKALEYFNQSLPLYRAVSDKEGEAVVLNNIGGVYSNLDENQKAVEYYDQSLSLFRVIGNKSNEATTLTNIGKTYASLGENEKALEYYNQALPLSRAARNKNQEAKTLTGIAGIYNHWSENQKALELYNQALSLFRFLGYKSGEAATLSNIGKIYSTLGEKQKALEYYTQSLPLRRAVGDISGEATTLNNIGKVYSDLGEKQKALEYYNKSLPLRRAVGDISGEATTLSNIGLVYGDLGENEKALEYYTQSLPLSRAAGDKRQESNTLNNIGKFYSDLGDKQKALEYFQKSLPFYRAAGEKQAEAVTLNNIGSIYSDLGEKQKALEVLIQSLPLTESASDKKQKATTLNNIGSVYKDLGNNQKALEYYNQSLLLSRIVGDKNAEAVVLNNIMFGWELLQNSRVAVFYGKQSVNKYQELRHSIKGLDKEIQKTYLKSVEDTYRKLADLLIGQGNFAQAEQILTMLKQEEYFEFVRRDAGEIDKLGERVPLDEKEKALIERYARLADKITVIGQEFIRLDDKKRQLASEGAALSPEEQRRYDELEEQLETASTAFQLFLNKELAAELGGKKTGEIEIDRKLQAKLRQWGEGTVALYTVAGADRYRVVLTTATAQVDGKTEIKIADLNKKVFAFRDALQNPKIDPRPLGKELYDILIKPVEKELAAAGAKTLIWSLDGTLRYIPLAALSPDGKKYLVEQWQNVVITTRTRDNISESNTDWEALGLGVSEARIIPNPDNNLPKIPFSTLAETERELTAIVKDEKAIAEKGILPGRRYMNGDFTTGIFKESMAMKNKDGSRKFNVVHIASHFRLGSSDSNSFILLGGGQILTLEEIRRSPAIDFSSVELITLSACNTAFADDTNGREVDSLASVIQSKNGKAVLATLWKVADQSTSHFMIEFYRLRKENPKLTKAEAIQSAQKAMLSAAACKDGKECYTHPYYWSPFILIGNWR